MHPYRWDVSTDAFEWRKGDMIRSPERNPTSGIFPLSVGSHCEGEGTRRDQLLAPPVAKG